MKNRLFILLAILLLACSGMDTSACHQAFQYRLFPIGIADSSLVVIELNLVRNLRWGDRWEGQVSLYYYFHGKKYGAIKQFDSVVIWDSIYTEQLQAYFDGFFETAAAIPGFVKGGVPSVEYCRHKRKCKLLSLSFDKRNYPIVQAKNKRKFKLNYPEEVIKDISFLGYLENQPFYLQSVRKMEIAGKEYIIANIGTGEPESTNLKTQWKSPKQFLTIESCIYKELTLYHGLCFDSIIQL